MIYLDNHATTRIDPRVLEAMLPYLRDEYANPGSVTHEFGRKIAEDAQQAIVSIAAHFSGTADGLVITSGATEALNLAIFGVSLHPRMKRRKIVAVKTEHRAVLDPLQRLESQGFQIEWLPVHPQGRADAGALVLDAAERLIDDETALVCVMLVNNEIGVIQPIKALSDICHKHDAIMLCDATAAAGRMQVDTMDLGVDLLAFSAHKFYGPKGVGGLYIDQTNRSIRLRSQIVGGGQQKGFRSGTLNVPGLIGMAEALQISLKDREADCKRIQTLQQKLWNKLYGELGDKIQLNGPALGKIERLKT